MKRLKNIWKKGTILVTITALGFGLFLSGCQTTNNPTIGSRLPSLLEHPDFPLLKEISPSWIEIALKIIADLESAGTYSKSDLRYKANFLIEHPDFHLIKEASPEIANMLLRIRGTKTEFNASSRESNQEYKNISIVTSNDETARDTITKAILLAMWKNIQAHGDTIDVFWTHGHDEKNGYYAWKFGKTWIMKNLFYERIGIWKDFKLVEHPKGYLMITGTFVPHKNFLTEEWAPQLKALRNAYYKDHDSVNVSITWDYTRGGRIKSGDFVINGAATNTLFDAAPEKSQIVQDGINWFYKLRMAIGKYLVFKQDGIYRGIALVSAQTSQRQYSNAIIEKAFAEIKGKELPAFWTHQHSGGRAAMASNVFWKSWNNNLKIGTWTNIRLIKGTDDRMRIFADFVPNKRFLSQIYDPMREWLTEAYMDPADDDTVNISIVYRPVYKYINEKIDKKVGEKLVIGYKQTKILISLNLLSADFVWNGAATDTLFK